MSSSVLFSKYWNKTALKKYHQHVVCIGGGSTGKTISRLYKEHLPEYSEYLNMQGVDRYLRESKFLQPKSTHVLFGSGQNTHVVRYPGLFYTFLAKLLKKENKIAVEPPLNLKGGATLEAIDKTFTHLAQEVEPGDQLLIYLNGHGKLFHGMILWNELITKHILTPNILMKNLKKLPDGIQVKLVVESCYSGIYQKLSSSNITVFTSANASKVSWYTQGEANAELGIFLENLDQSNLLIPFSSANIQSGNFYAMDSLSYFLETSLMQNCFRLKVERTWTDLRQAFVAPFSVPLTLIVANVAIAIFITMDPTGVVGSFYYGKLAVFLGKSSFPLVKALTTAALFSLFPQATNRMSNRIQQTHLYKNWYVIKDRRLVKKWSNNYLNPDFSKELSEEDRDKLTQILSALKDLKIVRAEDKRYSHYYYLYDKAVIFLQNANFDEQKMFIKMAMPVLKNEF
jgi:hypothetical protein